MRSDRPIVVSKDDKFERESFASDLASVLLLTAGADSLVVGLEGGWGTGKSSILSMTKTALLKTTPKPIIVEFNPWLISSLDSILEGFLVQLAAKLGTYNKTQKARDTAKRVLSFAKLMAPIKFVPGAEPWVSLAQKALEGMESMGSAVDAAADFGSMDLEAKKADVQKALSAINKSIVVLVDDVDRLPPKEVRVVFQLIKAVADFDRVSYLVAFDPEPVRNALSFDKVYDGGDYLDKIIQLSIPMPRFSYGHRRQFFEDIFEETLRTTGVEADEDVRKRLGGYLDNTSLIHLLRTPREIVRLMNKIRMSLCTLGNEVNIADLVAFRFIELRYPAVVRDIADSMHQYIDVYGDDREVDRRHIMDVYVDELSDQSGDKKSYLSSMLDRLVSKDSDCKAVGTVLKELFPKLGGANGWREEIDMTRICHRSGLLKVMHQCAPSFTLPYSDFVHFARSPHDRARVLDEVTDDDKVGLFLVSLQEIPTSLDVVDPLNFCQVIMDHFRAEGGEDMNAAVARAAGSVIHSVWMRIADKELRKQVVDYVVGNLDSVAISETAALHLLRHYGVWRDGKYHPDETTARHNAYMRSGPFSYAEVYAARELWLEAVKGAAYQSDLMRAQPNFLSILHRWGQLSDDGYADVKAYVQEKCKDRVWLDEFMRLFHRDTNLSEIAIFFSDPKPIIQQVEESFGEDEHAKAVCEVLKQKLMENGETGGGDR